MDKNLNHLQDYQCHKKVKAQKISRIDLVFDTRTAQVYNIQFEGGGFVDVDGSWVDQHQPRPGGYFVIYSDGYQSFSPEGAFEDGYSLIKKGEVQDGKH